MTSFKVPRDFNPDFLAVLYHPSFISRRRLYKSIKNFSKELNGKLLDFGSGAKPYHALFAVDEYIGIDIKKSGHDHQNSKVDVFYDGKTIPFGDTSFDSCFSSEVVEHIFNLPEILCEIHRVVKPGGKILITIPFAIHEHETPFDFARYTSFGIQDLLIRHGFEILKSEKTNHYVEAIAQLIVWYNASLIYKKFRLLTLLQLLILVAPVNIIGWLLSKILPSRTTLFSNFVVLAKRV